MAHQDAKFCPPVFRQFADSFLPTVVKRIFLNRDNAFNDKDIQFFFKSIRETSYLFTHDRSKRVERNSRDYFSQAKHRSSYILYFLPIHLLKFLYVFQQTKPALLKQLESKTHLRVCDLGSGPGTASLALVLWLSQYKKLSLESIEFVWLDRNSKIMADGKKLLESWIEQSRFPIQIKIRSKAGPISHQSLQEQFDLYLVGNLINESTLRPTEIQKLFVQTLSRATIGSFWIEPAIPSAAQTLSQIRDLICENQIAKILAPCPHQGKCPFSKGRDWCHFSEPVETAVRWHQKLSRMLKSEVKWLKFSYLVWGAFTQEQHNWVFPSDRDLLVSDPLPLAGQRNKKEYLVCRPNQPERIRLGVNKLARRGSKVKKTEKP